MSRSPVAPVALVTLSLLFATSAAHAAEAEKAKPHAQALRRECDALLAQVIKRPYGWGWSQDLNPAREPVVSLEPLQTPAAGLMLLYASELLDEPAYAGSAYNVGRLLAASLQSSGQIPSHVAMGTKLLNREKPRPLPNRASTRASLALLLSLVKGKEVDLNQDELLTRAAGRGAGWLVKQQPRTGAWPIVYPADADPQTSTRLVRLDTPDTRDNLLAMLLAYEVLGEESNRRSVERSISFLLRVRNPVEQKTGAGMFGPAFDPGGSPVQKRDEFPFDSTDALASRYATQSLFTAYVVMGSKEWGDAASVAADAALKLPVAEPGRWHRWYTPRGDAIRPEATRLPPVGFGDDTPDPLIHAWGLPQTIEVVRTHDQLGREQFLTRLKSSLTIKQRLALTVCGLIDEPLRLDLPASLDPAPNETGELPDRVRKLWVLYLRAKLEQAK